MQSDGTGPASRQLQDEVGGVMPAGLFLLIERRAELLAIVALQNTVSIVDLQMLPIIIDSLVCASLMTVGDIRKVSDHYLKCVRGIGPYAFRYLRVTRGRGDGTCFGNTTGWYGCGGHPDCWSIE